MDSLSAHLSDDWPFVKKLEARLSDLRMKRSPYLLWLVERDLTGHVDDKSPTILVDLAKAFLGPIKGEDMATACEGLNQRRELHDLLERYLVEHSEKQKHPRRAFSRA